MRYRVLSVLIALLYVPAAFAAFGDVISSFDMPCVGGGLAWDGAYLWACGQPDVWAYRLTTTGSVVSSFRLTPGSYGYYHGATYDGAYLWTAWYKDFDPNSWIARFTTTGSRVSGFDSFGAKAGITWESGYIWHSFRKYTTTGSLVGSFNPPFLFKDLAWDGHYLWTGKYRGDHMYRIKTNGSIMTSFAVPGNGEASGATFDGLYLWLVNATNGWAYQIDIDVAGMNPGSFGKIKALFR